MRLSSARALAVAACALAARDAAAQAPAPGPPPAKTPAECVAATERGQAKRDEGQLVASRAEFVACSGDACPAVVRRECVRWLAEVDARIPSLVVSVADSNGKDVLAPEVSLDGVRLPTAGVGRAFTLDPGPHVLRATGKEVEPVEETIVVRERERERIVKLVLRSHEPSPARAGSRPITVPRARTVPALSWVLSGVALVGGGGFAYFWARGMGKVSDLRDTCSPYCSSEQTDDARSPLTIARISGIVGIAAAIGAVTVYFLQPTTTQAAASAGPPGSFALTF